MAGAYQFPTSYLLYCYQKLGLLKLLDIFDKWYYSVYDLAVSIKCGSQDEQRLIEGIHEISGSLYDDLGFDHALSIPAVQLTTFKDGLIINCL